MLKRYTSIKDRTHRYMVKDERGATAIEYGLIAGLIAAVLVTALRLTGTSLVNIFNTIERAVRSGLS